MQEKEWINCDQGQRPYGMNEMCELGYLARRKQNTVWKKGGSLHKKRKRAKYGKHLK